MQKAYFFDCFQCFIHVFAVTFDLMFEESVGNMQKTDNFFGDIQSFDKFDRLFDEQNMHPVPSDWYVVVADVEGSTQAVSDGRYKDVNVVGASCIIAVLNEVDGIEIPYVFGGDGASFVVPPGLIKKVAYALCGTKAMAKEVFDLSLRVGAIAVSEIYKDGGSLTVSKYQISNAVSIAMFHGGGLGYGEACIKADKDGSKYGLENCLEDGATPQANFEGLECRWNPVKTRKDQILTLMVLSRMGDDVYQNVMQEIMKIYGQGDFSPVDTGTLKLSFNAQSLSQEHGVQTHGCGVLMRLIYGAKMRLENMLGTILLAFDWSMVGFEGKKYSKDVVANTDFQKFDDTLRMVLDSDKAQGDRLHAYLEAEHEKGNLFYGISTSDSAMLTCLIFERDENHIHFVDGQAGGYTMAAKNMKQQMIEDVEEMVQSEAL